VTYRSALITGASSGIGEAIARLLPAQTDLLLHGRDATRLAALAGELAAPGRRVEVAAFDLAVSGASEQLAEQARKFEIDLLVNNAGIGQRGRFDTNSLDAEKQMIAVNVLAPVVLTRLLLPGILERARTSGQRGGVIIVASVVGFGPVPYFSTYSATKSFDLRWAQGLAEEFAAEPVDVLALCPGGTATRFGERAGSGRSGGHSAERVAREGLAALGKQRVHVVGLRNSAVTLAFKLLPGRLMSSLAARATK
jgi:short-subunit dehydrogenase